MFSAHPSATGEDHRVAFAQQQQQRQQQQQQQWQQQQQTNASYPSAGSALAPISSPERVYRPNGEKDTSGRQPPSPIAVALPMPTENATNPFLYPFSTPAPSPALAWAPIKSHTGSAMHEKEEGVSRGMIGGGDTGRERKSVFWNRFSVVAHKASAVESDAGWLQAKNAKDSRMGRILWLMVFVVLFIVAGAITAHYLIKKPVQTTGAGTNRYGSLGSPSSAGDITTDVSTRHNMAVVYDSGLHNRSA